MTRDELPTPALILDRAALAGNIATMAQRLGAAGVAMRPHAKAHKSPVIAAMLASAGALGPACATVREAEAMAAAGLAGILVTSPVASPDALARLRRLLERGADVTVVVDDLAHVAMLAPLAAAAGRRLAVVVDLDAGLGRTGCADAAVAAQVALAVAAAPSLRFAGVQAYWGQLQQVTPLEERQRRVDEAKGRLRATIAALHEAGLEVPIVTGGGTGTGFLDAAGGPFTELQPGSFLLLDSLYGPLPLEAGGNPFTPSLFVRATVVSRAHPGRVVVNAGLKAFATDSGRPVPWHGAPPKAAYRFMGDEHGAVEFDPGLPAPTIGAAIEFLTSHCDPTVNLYDAYAVVDGEAVVDRWPIARGFAA